MSRLRWLVLPAIILALISVLPAQAQGPANPSVTDLGRNVYEVNGFVGDIPNLLPSADVEKMRALQSHLGIARVMQRVHPEGNYALVYDIEAGPAVLDTRTGAPAPYAFGGPDYDLFASLLTWLGFGSSDLFCWVDPNTLGAYGAALTEDGDIIDALVITDVRSGAVNFVQLPGAPFSLSPDCGTAAFIVDTTNQEAATVKARVTWAPVVKPQISLATLQKKLKITPKAPATLQRIQQRYAASNELWAFAEVARLYTYSLRTGAVTELFPFEEGDSLAAYPSWTQDGTRIAVSAYKVFDPQPRSRGEKGIFDGAIISEQVYRDVTGNLAPAENPLFAGNRILIGDTVGGTTKTLAASSGDGAWIVAADWSSDNQTLLVKGTEPGRLRGRTHPIYTPQFHAGATYRFVNYETLAETGRLNRIETSSILSSARFITPDEVIFTSNYLTDWSPYYFNRVSGEFRRVVARPGSAENIVVFRGSRSLFFSHTSFTEPLEYYRVGWDGQGLQQLTNLRARFAGVSNLRQDAVEFTVSGQIYRGVLIQPADAPFPPQNQRIIVWQEGGPTSSLDSRWLALVESPFALLPNFGFGLLVVPLQGRFGVGPAQFNALYDSNNFGQIDIDTQADISRQMIQRGWTSAGRLGIVGCSYGGYFVTQSITRHPGLYSAAHAQCALVDNFVEWNRGYASLMPYIEGLPPWYATEEYRRDSPIFQANRNTTPLLTFHGTEDFLPIALNENFHLQQVNNNVSGKMLKFIRAGHGINNIVPFTQEEAEQAEVVPQRYELYGAQEQLIWFRTYLP
jgi:dipeptidyl aminopeptidase/acylaminoacyl peptidase